MCLSTLTKAALTDPDLVSEALANGVKVGEANFDSVIVWSNSRAARRATELSEFRTMLAEKGIDLVSVREPVMDLDSPFEVS